MGKSRSGAPIPHSDTAKKLSKAEFVEWFNETCLQVSVKPYFCKLCFPPYTQNWWRKTKAIVHGVLKASLVKRGFVIKSTKSFTNIGQEIKIEEFRVVVVSDLQRMCKAIWKQYLPEGELSILPCVSLFTLNMLDSVSAPDSKRKIKNNTIGADEKKEAPKEERSRTDITTSITESMAESPTTSPTASPKTRMTRVLKRELTGIVKSLVCLAHAICGEKALKLMLNPDVADQRKKIIAEATPKNDSDAKVFFEAVYARDLPPYEDLHHFVSKFWVQPKEKTGLKRFERDGRGNLRLYGEVHLCGRYVSSWAAPIDGQIGYLYVIRSNVDVLAFQATEHDGGDGDESDESDEAGGGGGGGCGGGTGKSDSDVDSNGDEGDDSGDDEGDERGNGGGGGGEGKSKRKYEVDDDVVRDLSRDVTAMRISSKESRKVPDWNFAVNPKLSIVKLGKTDVTSSQTKLQFGSFCSKDSRKRACALCAAMDGPCVLATSPIKRWCNADYKNDKHKHPEWKKINKIAESVSPSRCDRKDQLINQLSELSPKERHEIICIIPRPSKETMTSWRQVQQAEEFLRGTIGTPMFVRNSSETIVAAEPVLTYIQRQFWKTLDREGKLMSLRSIVNTLTEQRSCYIRDVHLITRVKDRNRELYENHQRIVLRVPELDDDMCKFVHDASAMCLSDSSKLRRKAEEIACELETELVE